jgi:hypothetical protein
MATYANKSKNIASFVNQALGFTDLTWDEALMFWSQINGTWDTPKDSWVESSKASTTMVNQGKN